jgi:hypothetical protein
MVIENIFISGFRKSDPYYVITVLLRNIGYYRVTKFLFKINRAERLTCKDVSTNGQAAYGEGASRGTESLQTPQLDSKFRFRAQVRVKSA